MKAPGFWQAGRGGFLAYALRPLGCLYGAMTQKRAFLPASYKSRKPVICIGNLIMGGAGKTPTALALADMLKNMGLKPCFLSRGYGGALDGPVWVEDQSAQDVGDEPLLLAKAAPVCVAKDRAKGAAACDQTDCDVILLDDGFQNPTLAKDFSLIVIDGGYGHGNAQLFPAGPLRETLNSGLPRADAVLLIGRDQTAVLDQVNEVRPDLPVIKADIVVDPTSLDKEKPVFAFAGIARPEKFYTSLRENGFDLRETRDFSDHHPFSATEISDIKQRAEALEAQVVTTEKDLVRLNEKERDGIHALKIALAWKEPDMVKALLRAKLQGTDQT